MSNLNFTSQIQQVELNNPPVDTLNYTNNFEIVTTESASTKGYGSPMFLANISTDKTLAQMASLASLALAQSGQATVTYKLVESGTAPSGSPTKVFVLSSLEYEGKTVNVS